MRQSITCALVLLTTSFTGSPAFSQSAPKPGEPPVVATVETSLKTGSGQIRQFAFDGDDQTFFASEQVPAATDHFTLVLDKPVEIKRVAVTTGGSNGDEKLAAGTLEFSTDGKEFKQLASFAEGQAKREAAGQKVLAVRIKPGDGLNRPLVIRELSIESEPAVAVFKYPIEVVVDVKDAPEMQEWADKVARVCEKAYPMLNEELNSDGYKPAHLVTMRLSTSFRGVAATGGTRITGSVKFFKDHPDDVGAMVHEMAHVVQRYRGRGNPGWLVEGVADYVRFFKFEPGNVGPLNVERARYDRSYRVSARFLAYLVEKYDKDAVRKLNQAMREGKYKEDLFKELTGKTVEELDTAWRLTLRK